LRLSGLIDFEPAMRGEHRYSNLRWWISRLPEYKLRESLAGHQPA
jgi:hypothetical protein